MTQDQPSRLERIEATLEAMGQRMGQMQQRFDQHFDQQMQINADLRARQEIQSQQLDQLIEIAEITLNSIQGLRNEFNQHRSDGHGA